MRVDGPPQRPSRVALPLHGQAAMTEAVAGPSTRLPALGTGSSLGRGRGPRSIGGIAPAVLVVIAAVATYWELLAGLVQQWAHDDNYSHGFLILPLSAYFAWQRRAALAAAPPRPSAWGLVFIAIGVSMLVVGTMAAEVFVARVSLVVLIAGCIAFLYGREHLRILRVPVLFLLLMIPLPAIVFNQIAFPLQLFASQVGEVTIRAAGVPVLRDGNVLELETLRLEVAEACSGIRSLVSLLTLAVVLGQLGRRSPGRIWLLALATVPIAVAANAGRVAGTGLAAHIWGKAVAEGFLHTASGALAFAVAVAAIVGLTSVRWPRWAQG
jgi:exosortase